MCALTLRTHERHRDEREALGAREGLGQTGGVVEVGHVRLDAHLGVRSERRLAVAAEDELVMRCQLEQDARGLPTEVAVDASQKQFAHGSSSYDDGCPYMIYEEMVFPLDTCGFFGELAQGAFRASMRSMAVGWQGSRGTVRG